MYDNHQRELVKWLGVAMNFTCLISRPRSLIALVCSLRVSSRCHGTADIGKSACPDPIFIIRVRSGGFRG